MCIAPFQRYGRFSAEKSDPTPIPPEGVFALDWITDIVAPRSEDPKLIIRVITFELTQHIRLGPHNVAHGRTDDLR